ncbi:MAG: BON domain-containing protein [Bryobacteraceae bacterium]
MIRRQVEDELDLEPSLDAAGIGVAVHSGVVTLSGHVASFAEFQSAQRAALRVAAVGGVANTLEVRLSGAQHRTDEDIAIDAAAVLRSSAQVPDDQIKVTVHEGHVVLEGEVDWRYQAEAADRLVSHLIGVKDVICHISIRRREPNGSVKDQVEAALARSALSNPKAVKVETRADHVVLRGTLPARWERDEAERIAWSVRGVCHVDNNLGVVTPRRDGF